MMNRTFIIISPYFSGFNKDDFYDWFHVKLVLILASFSPTMFNNATSDINCTNYHIVVRGMGKVFHAMPSHRQQGIADAMLGYMRKSASVINTPVCRQGIANDARWLEANLGPFSQYTTYPDLKSFNLSGVDVLDSLSMEQKADFLLEPNNLSNETLVKLVFTKVTMISSVEELGSFFDKFVHGYSDQNLTSINPKMRDTILNLTLTALGPKLGMLNAEGFKIWFQVYLPLFLPSVDASTLTVIPRNIPCNSYQNVIKGFNNVFTQLSVGQTQEIFMFTKDYLQEQSSSGLSCVESVNDDRHWLENNFGQFGVHASYMDFVTLNKNFSGVEVADLLTSSQLAQLAATPSQLNTKQDVTKVMAVINPGDFGAFFDTVSPAIEAHPDSYTDEVKSAFLQSVYDRAGLSSLAVSDKEFVLWLRLRLRPLLVNLSPTMVAPLSDIGTNRNCNSSQEIYTLLDTLYVTLSNNTRKEIYNNIVHLLQGQRALKCYTGGSFYIYLRNTFLSFGFPDLSTLLSLVPPEQQPELLSTISTSELQQLLSLPNVITNSSDVCTIFNNYNKMPAFLETEDVPDNVKKVTLPCVWPLALSSTDRSEANLWFTLRLRKYLKFLSKSLISVTEVQKASCFGFQKMVSVMGNNFTYNGSDFGEADVYTSIKDYLSTGSEVRCYNASDAALNSTSWFVNNIGQFVTFITLDDITNFVSTTQSKVFLEDQANLALFNNILIPGNVTNYYITQLFAFSPAFSPLRLPGLFLCSSEVPSMVYSSLNEHDAILILEKLNIFCNGTEDPEVSAALASNIKTFTSQTIAALGSASAGLTTSQITSVPGNVLVGSLSTLGSVSTWSLGQATTIIKTIIGSGFQINNGAKLESLGRLVVGVPSEAIEKITATELLGVSKSPTFVVNMLAAPTVVQQTFVKKIISLDTNPAQVLLNVPDAMATEIPPSLLVFSEETVNISVINKKSWTQDQAAMFFGTLATSDFDIEQLSPFLLQGFTCTSVQKMSKTKIQNLIHSCRPKSGRAKVQLQESQLTCMYNLLRGNLSQNFANYPSDMLLYFSNNDVSKENCRSYFSALGAADFSVASTVLNKDTLLLNEATTCLGIKGLNLSKDNVEVLGNMACTMDGSYIKNSDPLILEQLKKCKDFSDVQVAAMETLLLSGNTQYGNVSTWDEQTLVNLGPLPLYFTNKFWDQFQIKTKKRFLKTFMPSLRKEKRNKNQLKRLFKQVNTRMVKRGADCTTGNITQVTVNDDSFPFGYDLTQFDLCLDVPVLKDNLNDICDKVDDDGLQKVILRKLNQAYPSGVSDQDVQVLGSVSRVASLDDIAKWNITKVDTLAALMRADDGPWEAAKSKEIITKYLSTSGNSLGSTELKLIGSNLCSLPTSTLTTIPPESIRNGNPLNVASCSTEQKKVLYKASNTAFSSHRASPSTYYNLIKSTICGAPLADVVALSTQNISMDVDTFRSLDSTVIPVLTVTNVQGLMGNHLSDLKVFENDTVVQAWVNLQLQSDLDRLGIGLISNRTEPATTTTSSSSSSSSSTSSATAKTTQAATTSGVAEFRRSSTSTVLATLLITALQMLQRPT
ncbi:uncharacterized protein LOC114427536 isoform X2 [Parambassis ranga]|uniref:Uncharacterized protein LOC114427536 isoform X2 n=1 Tax=Parambassis ranga TaxID=210632 RepID=A0A6P7HS30_9TELE|nr:uncharacterized protein LOC114427536 isoform X2 [Parambassis ranga]